MILFKTIKYQLYLLQLENYELGRYFKLLLNKGLFPKIDQRKDLVWTIKARVLFSLAIGTHLATFGVGIYFLLTDGLLMLSIMYLVLCIALFYLYFILYTIYLILLYPIDFLAKEILVRRAKSKILNLQTKIKIIGVAGSYGKTTMKEMLRQVLGIKYKVLSTPDSVNTPVGISKFILKYVSDETQILILEMGEHYKGDVKEICTIAKPDIAVITGINESHLERMGSLENISETIFEVAQNSKSSASVFLNGEDKIIIKSYKDFILNSQVAILYAKKDALASNFSPDALGWEIEYKNIGKVFVKLLGEYAVASVSAVIEVALMLGMSPEQIKQGVETIVPVSHRLEPIKSSGGALIIDDAYNGNPKGVEEAIKLLSRFTNRRKVYITPGLVEMGSASVEVHKEIGKQLALVANVVVLIKNSVTAFIEEGIKSANQQDGKLACQIIWFNTAQEAHAALGKMLQPNDVVVFQNDWGDQYI
jgi:UDP-N-acetylmuramoyl-tripeptide--D-alanyl-D-alanine ligase